MFRKSLLQLGNCRSYCRPRLVTAASINFLEGHFGHCDGDEEPEGASLIASLAIVPEAPAPIHSSITFTSSDDKARLPSFGMKSLWLGAKVIRRKRSLP